MYRFLSVFLAALLLVGGFLFYLEKRDHGKTKLKYNNQVAELEGTIQETESALSRRALLEKDLKTKNEELQDKIDDRDEQILSQAKLTLKWRDKYFKIKNAKQEVVIVENKDGTTTKRDKVTFSKEDGILAVSGYTLTNPAFAEVKLRWVRPLQLEVNLAKDDDGNFRVYVDSDADGLDIGKIFLVVDPSVTERRWYEKIGVGADVTLGRTAFRAWYEIMGNWYVGPSIISDSDFHTTYGITIGYYPFR